MPLRFRRARRAPLLAVPLLALAAALPAAAQEARPAFDGLPPGHERSELQRIDSLYVAENAQGSLDAAEALIAEHPDDFEASVRAARAALALGIAAPKRPDQKTWYLRAEKHGEHAVALDSMRVEGLYWLAAARGRRTLIESPRVIVPLAKEVYALANRILVLDPHHAGALNIIGKFHFELLILSGFERFVAKHLLGGDELIEEATWAEAQRNQLAAVAAAPFMILFHYDLARVYARQGMREEARKEYETVLVLPVRHPPDGQWQANSRRALDRMAQQQR